MTFIDTLLIDGTDVAALPGVIAVDYIDGLYAPGQRRGDDDDIPQRDGSLGAQLPLAKYLITVPLWVAGATTAALNSNLRALGTAVQGTGGLVTLTRYLDNGAGHDTHTAPGRFATGLTPTGERTHSAVQLDLQFYNLAGAWFDSGAPTTPIVP